VIAVRRRTEILLQRLPRGHSAHVARIVGPAEDVHRLEEFGLRPGTKVKMFRRGSPCILRVAGSKICLRLEDRLQVFVTPKGMTG
jgi:ferrous iron transport protein A